MCACCMYSRCDGIVVLVSFDATVELNSHKQIKLTFIYFVCFTAALNCKAVTMYANEFL